MRGLITRPAVALRHSVRRLSVAERALPDFIVLGAQKSGTWSLYEYLMASPRAHAPLRKEIHFFDYGYARGLDWYRAFFPKRSEIGVDGFTGEASPSYLFHDRAPERVAASVPEARLLALLRDPTARAWSHYRHNVRKGREPRTFLEAVEHETAAQKAYSEASASGAEPDETVAQQARHYSYVARGLYAQQLERWYRHVPRERMLLMRAEDLFRGPAATLASVAAFLGVEPHEPDAYAVHNKGSGSPEIPDDVAAFLEERFSEPNRALADLTEGRIEW